MTSDVDVDLLDIHGSTAVVSETPCPAGTPDRVLATWVHRADVACALLPCSRCARPRFSHPHPIHIPSGIPSGIPHPLCIPGIVASQARPGFS